MGEDDIVELLWKSGQVLRSSQRPTSDNPSPPPPILRREENAQLPSPPPLLHHQNLFIQEDEIASRLYHPLRQDYFCSEFGYSGVASTPATHPQSSSAAYGQIMNFSRTRGNIFTGGRVEPRPSMQVGSSVTTESYLTSATHGTESRPTVIGGVSRTFTVPGRGRKEKAAAVQTVCEIAGTSSSGVETEPVQIQPATETDIAEDKKRMEREATIAEIMASQVNLRTHVTARVSLLTRAV